MLGDLHTLFATATVFVYYFRTKLKNRRKKEWAQFGWRDKENKWKSNDSEIERSKKVRSTGLAAPTICRNRNGKFSVEHFGLAYVTCGPRKEFRWRTEEIVWSFSQGDYDLSLVALGISETTLGLTMLQSQPMEQMNSLCCTLLDSHDYFVVYFFITRRDFWIIIKNNLVERLVLPRNSSPVAEISIAITTACRNCLWFLKM